MIITSGVGGSRATVVGIGLALALAGCAGSSTATRGDSNSAESQPSPPPASAPEPAATKPSVQQQQAPQASAKPKHDAAIAEGDALVKIRPGMFPPTDAGAWVCEPKNWTAKSALIHCTAPAGSADLLTSLKQLPQVVSAELAK